MNQTENPPGASHARARLLAAYAPTIRRTLLLAATVALGVSPLLDEWLSDGRSWHRAVPLAVLSLLLLAICWWSTTATARPRAGVAAAAAAGGTAIGGLLGLDAFAPGGAGLGWRVPILLGSLLALALTGLTWIGHQAAAPKPALWWLRPAAAASTCVALAAATWFGAPALQDSVNVRSDTSTPIWSPEAPPFTTPRISLGSSADVVTGTPVGALTRESVPTQEDGAPSRVVLQMRTSPPATSESRRWSYSRSDLEVVGSTIVGGGRIVLTYQPHAFDPDVDRRTVVMLDQRTGRAVGEFVVPHAGLTPIAASATRVVLAATVSDKPGALVVTDLTGRPVWERPVDREQCQASASVIDGGDAVLSVSCRAKPLSVSRVDLNDGKARWTRSVPSATGCPAAAHQFGAALVLSMCGLTARDGGPDTLLVGIDPASGATKWTKALTDLTRISAGYPFRFYPAQWAIAIAKPGIVVASRRGIAVHDPADGRLLRTVQVPVARSMQYPALDVAGDSFVLSDAPWASTFRDESPVVWVR